MPLTNYSNSQEAVLDSFARIDNFRSRAFTFVNSKSGIRIPEAISMNTQGELVFKDRETEVYLSELINSNDYLEEGFDDEGNDILFFQDDFNSKISLGRMYANVVRFANSNLVFWASSNVNKVLERTDGLDPFLLENVFKSFQEDRPNAVSTVVDDINEHRWKNRWADVCGMAIETPDYVDGKFASISCRIPMVTRSDRSIYTGFRILDATTGIELARTVHATKGQSGKDVRVTVPISYQGPLPDTDIPKNATSDQITYKDLQNLGIQGTDNDSKSTAFRNGSDQEIVAQTKHLIKVQWITCDISTLIMTNGDTLDGVKREFDPDNEATLEMSIFSSDSIGIQVGELNGVIEMDEVDTDTYFQKYETIPYGITDNYNVLFTANKNVNVSLISKSKSGFTLKVNRKIEGLKIDWSLTYNLETDVDQEKLTDTQRELNHFLFKEPKDAVDFCGELRRSAVITIPPPRQRLQFGFSPCSCCDCCTDDEVDVLYELQNGLTSISCDDSEIADQFDPEVDCDGVGKGKDGSDDPNGIPGAISATDNGDGGSNSNGSNSNGSDKQVGAVLGNFIPNTGDGGTGGGRGINGEVVVDQPYIQAFDSFGNVRYSYDLDFEFIYLATIAVDRNGPSNQGTPDPPDKPNPPLTYDFFNDLYTSKAVVTDIIPLSGGDSPQSRLSIGGNGKFFENTKHCDYYFDSEGSERSKIVSAGESVTVYKLLASDVTLECNDPGGDGPDDDDVETIDTPVILPPNIQNSFADVTVPEYLGFNVGGLSSVFNRDLLFNGLDNGTLSEFNENEDLLEDLRRQGLEKLKYDMKKYPKELPAQAVSDNLIKLDLNRDAFESYFENSSSPYLISSASNPIRAFINTNEGFLSIRALKHNLIAFDPRPEVDFTLDNTTYFPTFDPIYNRKSYRDILEYIYTAVYPTATVPVFPNFRIGDIAVNGALYNPLFDFRNYRSFGFYQTFIKKGQIEKIFVSDSITNYLGSVRIGKIVKIQDKYYQVKRDLNNNSPIYTTRYNGKPRRVKPSDILFKEVTQEMFDLNPALQVVW